ncbi:hypothetical protein JCM16418_3198 [Paenibacillus pini JCM 16418]|uniref:Uncharacterized protein n=1 Tax=Paenibacillus pini JCM 16418 TaxID=1236976 RepID=W7YDV4_9BACL|nr:hypothetical protein JCM16418_3198 [Paenibacillus pini JCM 16418]
MDKMKVTYEVMLGLAAEMVWMKRCVITGAKNFIVKLTGRLLQETRRLFLI